MKFHHQPTETWYFSETFLKLTLKRKLNLKWGKNNNKIAFFLTRGESRVLMVLHTVSLKEHKGQLPALC